MFNHQHLKRRFQINLEISGLLKVWKVYPQELYISLKQHWAVAKCLPNPLLNLRTLAIHTAFGYYQYSYLVRNSPFFTTVLLIQPHITTQEKVLLLSLIYK